MITSTDTERDFQKNQDCFIIKENTQQDNNKREFPQIQNPTCNITVHGKD